MIGKYEVTQAQWQAVMGGECHTPTRAVQPLLRHSRAWPSPAHVSRTNPATVSWNDAQEFHPAPERAARATARYSPADRGGVGVCRAGGHDDRVLLRKRRLEAAGAATRGLARTFAVGRDASGRAEGAERLGPARRARQRLGVGAGLVRASAITPNSPSEDPQGPAIRIAARRAWRQLAPDRHKLAVGVPPLV